MVEIVKIMQSENKKQLIALAVISSLFLGFILIGFHVVNEENRLLEQNPVYSIGIIAETYIGAKARHYVRYDFKVNGKTYDGHQNYMPHRQYVTIGDTCQVVYAKSNPKISELLTDDNKLLKIRPIRIKN